MQKQTLEAIGLRTKMDIPAAEIFKASLDVKHYGLSDGEAKFIHCLRDFVQEYNREIPMQNTSAVTCSADSLKLMYDALRELDHEEVWVVMLNNANIPLTRHMICLGSLDASIIDSRRIIKTALELNAGRIILFHNHPSGNPEPSIADVKQTEKLRNALNVFDILLMDHIVVSESRYYSFADEKTYNIPRN